MRHPKYSILCELYRNPKHVYRTPRYVYRLFMDVPFEGVDLIQRSPVILPRDVKPEDYCPEQMVISRNPSYLS